MGEPFISTFYPFTHLSSLVGLFWTLKNKRIGHVCVLAVKNTSLISICRSIFQAETTENSFVLLRFTGTERPETGHPKVPEFLLWEFSERIIFSFFASSEVIPATETGCSASLGNWTDNSSSLSHCTAVCWFTSSAGCDGISPVGAGKNSGCDDKNCTCRWSSDKDEVRKALVSLLLSIQQTLRNLTIDVSSPLWEGRDQCSVFVFPWRPDSR